MYTGVGNMKKTAIATFRTKQELKNRIDILAKKTKRSAGFYYNVLLEEYLEDLEDIYLSEKIIEEVRSGKMKTHTLAEVENELDL